VPTPGRPTDVSTWSRTLAAAALVATVATGCGGGSAPPDSRGEPPAPSAAGAGGTPRASAAVSVRVVVTGGIAGDHQVYEVSRGSGNGSVSAARVLALAAAPAVRDFATQRRRPSVRCCDIQVYEVAIRYADGTSARIATDSTAAPPQLQRLVALVSTGR